MSLPERQGDHIGQLMVTVNVDGSLIFGDEQMRLTLINVDKQLTFMALVDKNTVPAKIVTSLGDKDLITFRVRPQELFWLADEVSVFVSSASKEQRNAIIGIRAPRDLSVHREKVFNKIKNNLK